jgi:hypothetical protein
LGTTPNTRKRGDFGTHRFVLGEYKGALPLGLDIEEGTMIQGVLWWCAMGCESAGPLRSQMFEIRENVGRIIRCLIRIDREVAEWNREVFFNDVGMMVRKGIPVSLVELCRLPGITKGKAAFLYEKGAHDASGIADVLPNIEDEIDEPFLDDLKRISSEFSAKSC